MNKHHFLLMCMWDAHNANASRTKPLLMSFEKFESLTSAGATKNNQGGRNFTQKLSCGHTKLKGNAKKCDEKNCELANKKTQQLHKVSTPCLDDHHFKEEEMVSVGELSKKCAHRLS